MTDYSQNQAISSAWIGNGVCVKESNYGDTTANGKWCEIEVDKSSSENDRMIDNESYFLCKDEHSIFAPISEVKPCETGQSLPSYFSNDPTHFSSQKQSNKIEDSGFSFDLSTECNSNRGNTDSYSDAQVKLNETFNISVGSTGQMEFCKNQKPEAMDKKIGYPVIKSVCFPEKSATNQFDPEFKALDKTISISTLDPEYGFKKNGFTRLDSEESLGIIPEVLENSWELLGSCSVILNKKTEACSTETDHEISEVFSIPSPNYHDLKEQCFEYIDRHIQINAGDCYTSTPKVPKNSVDSVSSEVFLQDKYSFPLNEGVRDDEPIIVGSSRTVSQILDAEEFDNDEIFTSTSKLSTLLQIHNHDLLNKTSNLDCELFRFKRQESGVCNFDNLTEASKETFEINKCKEVKAFAPMHHTDVINSTFEIKPESSHEMFADGNCLDASPILPRKCISLNKTITVDNLNNTPGMWNDTIRNSNLLELNRTQTLKSSDKFNCQYMNATYSEMTENQISFSVQLNECSIPASEIVDLCRTSTKSKKCSSRENINLAINSSDSSFKNATKNTSSTSEINTSMKNGELQAKPSASEHFKKRCSLSAYPTLQEANSFKFNPLTKSLPVPSKASYLHSSKRRFSNYETKDVAYDELRKTITKKANTTFLRSPVKADTFGSSKKSVNTRRRSNSLALQGTTVQSKELKYSKASLKSKVGFQAKAVPRTSPNDTFISNDISKRLSLQKGNIRSNHGSLKSHTERNYSKDKNQTFTSSDDGDSRDSQKMSEIADKISSNAHAVQIKKLPTEKYVSKIAKTSLKSKIAIQSKAVTKSALDCPFIKKDIPYDFSSPKNNMKAEDAFLNPCTETNHSKDEKQTFTASDDFYHSENKNLMQEKSETLNDLCGKNINDHSVQIELSTQNSATELMNLTKTKSDNSVAVVLDKNFINLVNGSHNKRLNAISEESTEEGKNINSNAPLKYRVKGIFPKPVNKPKSFLVPMLKPRFSSNLSETKYNCKNKHIANEFKSSSEISCRGKNDNFVQIKESPTDNSVTGSINLVETKNDYSVAAVLDKTFIDKPNDSGDKSSKDISEKLADECKNMKSNAALKCRAKGIFSKPLNKQRLSSFLPTFKSKVESNSCESKVGCKNEHIESVKDSLGITSKSKNDHTMQIKELPSENSETDIVNHTATKSQDSVADVLSKTFTDMPNDSHGKNSKDISEESSECNNVSTVSLKCHAKSIFSKPLNEQRLSFLPSLKSKTVNTLCESKDKHIKNELQDPSSITSKQCRSSIRIPGFHLNSRNVKETMRLEEKPLQKENIELNSPSLRMKESKLKSYQSGNGKFCQTGRVLKPIAGKASNVLTASIPQKKSSESVKLKPNHRIPSSIARRQSLPLRKPPAQSSQCIR